MAQVNASPALVPPVTDEQIESFFCDGYLVVKDLLEDADLQPVIDEVQHEIDQRAQALKAKGILSRLYQELPFEKRLAAITDETPEVASAIWNGNLNGPAFFNLIRNPKLLDVAERFCGPELIASSVYRLRPKVPNHPKSPVPWHQDSGYFEPYCDKSVVLTMWIPLVDATQENGCMWVLPKAHQGSVVPHQKHQTGYLEITEQHLPEGRRLCVPMKKGSVLLLHNRTPHASFDNNTDEIRWSIDLRYQSAALPTNARITRLESEVTPNAQQGIPGSCYPPEADFLVRSTVRPTEVITDPDEFRRLRKSHVTRPVTKRWQ